jgi:hypothetical protein
MKKYLFFLVLTVLSYPNVSLSSDDDELLNQVRIGHRAARQAVRQLSCAYLVRETLPAEKIMANGKYYRLLDVVAIKDGNEGISTRDFLIRNGQCKQVGREWKNGRAEYFAVLESGVQYFSWGDLWQQMLINQFDPEGNRCDYDMVLDRIAKAAHVSRDRVEGRDCIRIEVEEKTKLGFTKVLKIWHDVGKNYFIRKIESYDLADPKDRDTAEVTEFLEPAPGIVLPVKCRVNSFRADKLAKSYETVLSDIQLNQPFAESIMALPSVPKGTELQDSIRGKRGPIGPDWNTIGPTTTMERRTLPPVSENVGAARGGKPTESEPWSITQYVLYGSIVAFVLCVTILYLRKRAAQNAERDASD